jgi:hypothetical protein
MYVEETSRSEDWLALIVVVVAVVYGKAFLALMLFLGIAWLGIKFFQRREENKIRRMVNELALSMEADHQNMLHNQGDPAGMYGHYDAYTMPMTRSILDDHDDGMDNWR